MSNLSDRTVKMATAVITIGVPIATVVANYALYGYRIQQVEKTVIQIQEDRVRRIDEDARWKMQMAGDMASIKATQEGMKDDVRWVRQELSKR